MKKLFILLVAILSLFILSSCGKNAVQTENELIGEWELVDVTYEGASIQEDIVGYSRSHIEFNEDGSVHFYLEGGEVYGRGGLYEVEENLITCYFNQTVLELTLKGDSLIAKNLVDGELIYKKVKNSVNENKTSEDNSFVNQIVGTWEDTDDWAREEAPTYIIFTKDGKVELCYYGTQMHGIGTYTTNNKNKITCRFPDGQQIRFKYENDTLSANYMDMVYSREGRDIYLSFTKTEPETKN